MQVRGSHVKIDSLTHRYGYRGKVVLADVNLVIDSGEHVALVGRSGCGKSTLLQLISGMARPASGTVFIDGNLVRGPSPLWNVMFQKPLLFPWMSVRKNVSLGILFASGKKAEHQVRVDELLELVGLSKYAETNVQKLSGGQQQRVALARSLATNPELLLLDEPFSALDETTRIVLRKDVQVAAAAFGITLIVVTHDIDEAVALGQRIVVMSPEPGKIVADLDNDPSNPDAIKHSVRRCLEGGERAFNKVGPKADKQSNTMYSTFQSPPQRMEA